MRNTKSTKLHPCLGPQAGLSLPSSPPHTQPPRCISTPPSFPPHFKLLRIPLAHSNSGAGQFSTLSRQYHYLGCTVTARAPTAIPISSAPHVAMSPQLYLPRFLPRPPHVQTSHQDSKNTTLHPMSCIHTHIFLPGQHTDSPPNSKSNPTQLSILQ